VAGLLPWRTTPPKKPSKEPPQTDPRVEKKPQPLRIPNKKDLIGFTVVVVKKQTGSRRRRVKEEVIGVVTNVSQSQK